MNVDDLLGLKYSYHKALTRTPVKKDRKCLKCGRMFSSPSNGIRKCHVCARRTYSVMEEFPVHLDLK